MFALNKVQLIGHLTEKPELKQIGTGNNVTNLNIKSSTRVVKDDGSDFFVTSFHTVTVWGRMAEVICDYCDSGSQVFISGRARTENWQDESGQKKYKTKVIAEDVILLDSKKELQPVSENSLLSGGLNKIEIVGNLTKDVELRDVSTGQKVANFSVATNRSWIDKNTSSKQEETEFHNVVAWNKLATDASEILSMGVKVYVCGRLINRSWNTPDGQKRHTTEVIADSIIRLGEKSMDYTNTGGIAIDSTPSNKEEYNIDGSADLPEIKYESNIKPEDIPF